VVKYPYVLDFILEGVWGYFMKFKLFKKVFSLCYLVTTVILMDVSALDAERLNNSLVCIENAVNHINSMHESTKKFILNEVNLAKIILNDTVVPMRTLSNFSTSFTSAVVGRRSHSKIRFCDIGLPSNVVLNVNYRTFYDAEFAIRLLMHYINSIMEKLQKNLQSLSADNVSRFSKLNGLIFGFVKSVHEEILFV
jgi:hypothetical protein